MDLLGQEELVLELPLALEGPGVHGLDGDVAEGGMVAAVHGSEAAAAEEVVGGERSGGTAEGGGGEAVRGLLLGAVGGGGAVAVEAAAEEKEQEEGQGEGCTAAYRGGHRRRDETAVRVEDGEVGSGGRRR